MILIHTNSSTRRSNRSSGCLFSIYCTWTGPGLKPDCSDDRLGTNGMSHGPVEKIVCV